MAFNNPSWYYWDMETLIDQQALDALLDPLAECLTPEVARRIADLRADPALQARMDELGEKANEGLLTEAERREHLAYIEGIDIIGILQAKARHVLAGQSAVR